MSMAVFDLLLSSLPVQRSFPHAELEYRSCQFWSKVVMSELEQRAILVTVYYGRHTEASKRGYKWAHLTGQNLLVLLVGLPFWVPISLAPPLVSTFFMFLQRLIIVNYSCLLIGSYLM